MDAIVTLWTYQSLQDWLTLRTTGRLRRDDAHRAHIDPYYLEPYEWMRGEMRKRMPGYGGAWPIWAWAKEPPTLWNESFGWTFGTPFVRLELRVAAPRVLLSDFEVWHMPLNRSPVCLAEAESEAWDARPRHYNTLPLDVQAEIRATWERIFDLDALVQSPYWYGGDATQQRVQATLEEIRRDDVVCVIPCIGRQWPPAFLRR